jgi:hypothetical protein
MFSSALQYTNNPKLREFIMKKLSWGFQIFWFKESN